MHTHWDFHNSPSASQSRMVQGTEPQSRSEKSWYPFLALYCPAGSPWELYFTFLSLSSFIYETEVLEQMVSCCRILWIHLLGVYSVLVTFVIAHLISFFHLILCGTGVVFDLEMKKLTRVIELLAQGCQAASVRGGSDLLDLSPSPVRLQSPQPTQAILQSLSHHYISFSPHSCACHQQGVQGDFDGEPGDRNGGKIPCGWILPSCLKISDSTPYFCWYQWVSSIKEKRRALGRNTDHAGTGCSDVRKSDIHLVTSTIVMIFCSIEE